MTCPHCGWKLTKWETQTHSDGRVRRIRDCTGCQYKETEHMSKDGWIKARRSD